MFRLIPVFLGKHHDIMNSNAGFELIDAFLYGQSKAQSTDMRVITNHPTVEVISHRYGLETLMVSGKPPFLCPTLENVPDFINRYRPLDCSAYTLVINFRNPLVNERLLLPAAKHAKTDALPLLISVIKADGHPCRLFSLETSQKTLKTQDRIFIDMEDATYYKYEPFPPVSGLWKISEKNELINMQTGRCIQGRQDYPDIYVPDNSFFVVDPNLYTKNNSRCHIKTGIYGYLLDMHHSITIETQVDLLKFNRKSD